MLSPYAAIQGLLWASEVVRGDRSDTNNPLRWDKIMLNLHGDPSYSPTIPWMSKFQGGTQKLVADFITHLDDSREAEGSAKEAWRAARRVGLIWQYLGLQYAPRKRRIDRQDGGLWRGEKFHIID